MTMSEETPSPAPEPLPPRWREPLLAYLATLAILWAATLLGGLLSFVQANLLAVAAITFIAIPYFILERKKENFHRFGIDLERFPPRQILLGLAVTLLVFPFFLVGNHLWETHFLERESHFALQNYYQWPIDTEATSLPQKDLQALQLRSQSGDLILELRANQAPLLLSLEADHPVRLRSQTATLKPQADSEPFSTRWEIQLQQGRSAQVLLLRTDHLDRPFPKEIVLLDSSSSSPVRIYRGEAPLASDTLRLEASLWWILFWSLTHLLLIALPEEYFYRGYLQTRLQDLLDGADPPRTFLGFTRANWLTSALFALGHVLIPVGGVLMISRISVFFPSLIFGALRDRTGSIIAPVIFHAGANMMVLIVAVHYF